MENNVLTEGKTPSTPVPPTQPIITIGIGEATNGLTTNITVPPPPPATIKK